MLSEVDKMTEDNEPEVKFKLFFNKYKLKGITQKEKEMWLLGYKECNKSKSDYDELKEEIDRLNKILDENNEENKCNICKKHYTEDETRLCSDCENIVCINCLDAYSDGTSTEDGFNDDDFAICKTCSNKNKLSEVE